jgi:hypothetical protein
MADEVLTNLIVGFVMLLVGGFIAITPHRFLHPVKGKTVPHAKAAMAFMRICGALVCIGGIRFVLTSAWTIWISRR